MKEGKELVEAAARALFDEGFHVQTVWEWDRMPESIREAYRKKARIVIRVVDEERQVDWRQVARESMQIKEA